MLKLISKISLTAFLLSTPFLCVGFGKILLAALLKTSLANNRWIAFLTGAAVFFPCMFAARILIPKIWAYFETLEHELTHLVIGLLFLKIPVGIRVSAHEGGEVRQIGFGSNGQIWITLAPYFFPTVSLAVVVTAYFLKLNDSTLLGILGWTTAFHLVTNWAETSFRQPDLQKAGVVKTVLILPVMNLICYGAVLAFVSGGSRGFGRFWVEGAVASFRAAAEFWQWVLK